MAKKSKLDLNELEVQSFVTSLDHNEIGQLKGGGDDAGGADTAACTNYTCWGYCWTNIWPCLSSENT